MPEEQQNALGGLQHHKNDTGLGQMVVYTKAN